MIAVTYTEIDGCKFPNLIMPEDGLGAEAYIGIWGRRRLDYLKKHRRVLYLNLLTNGKLRSHLYEIDATAHERQEHIVAQMKAAQGVTEQLKTENQMLWVGLVNNICACADEIIREELIYI